MGLIFLVLLGIGIGQSSLYFLHGLKKTDSFLDKVAAPVQKLLDSRAKDRQ